MPMLTASAQGKKALLIAISHYAPVTGGWDSLSADADRRLMQAALRRQGFSLVLTCENRQATRRGMVAALQQLHDNLAPGDHVVVHYSGHGCQLPDDNGDEQEDDLDECLVPYDAPRRFPATYRGELHLRDDELGRWLDRLRARVGPTGHVLLLLDSCHSGAASRGDNAVRGESAYTPVREEGSAFFEPAMPPAGRSGSGRLIFISGARSTEANSEMFDDDGRRVGSLTYAWCKALLRAAKGTSYRRLFDEICTIVAEKAPGQTPQLEGEGQLELFAGTAVWAEPAFSVEGLTGAARQTLRIAGGKLAGLLEGTVMRFYRKAGTRGEAVATGTIVAASLLGAEVQIDRPVDQPGSLEAIEQKRVYRNRKVPVRIEGDTGLAPLIRSVAEVTLEKPAALVLRHRGDSVELIRAQTGVLFRRVAGEEAVLTALSDYAQASILRDIELLNSPFQAEMRVFAARLRHDGTWTIADTLNGGIPALSTRHQGWLIIRNTGNTPFYINLVDVEPGGKTTVLLPQASRPPEVLRLEAGKSLELPIERVRPPLGMEVYRLLMSDQPFDVRPAVASRGVAGDDQPFSFLFRKDRSPDIPEKLGTAVMAFSISDWEFFEKK
jgi:hypothetical protein